MGATYHQKKEKWTGAT